MPITVQNICKSFDVGQPVLDHVNLHIQDGEFICLLGPSGCGKTTLLNMIAGLDMPGEGQVLCDDNPVTGPGPERSYLFQESALFPWLNVQDNVKFGLRVAGFSREEQTRRAQRYLEMVGLWEYRNYRVHELSGGMKQRVALARALAIESKVLLMDEPFAALDIHTKNEIRLHLLDIWEETGKTILFVTHDIQEAFQLADRVVLLSSYPAKIIKEYTLPRPRNLAGRSIAAMMAEVKTQLSLEVNRIAS